MIEAFLRLIFEGFKEIQYGLYYKPLFIKILNRQNGFYNSLARPIKNRFLRTLYDNYDYFEFVSRKHFRLSRTIKVIISSGATQLALFLPPKSLSFYTKIIIYPEDYYSRITKLKHKGEVNPGFKLIVFSWKSISEELEKPKDGRNLLLHEFAHALWLEHKLMNHVYTTFNEVYIRQFEEEAKMEMNVAGRSENHFFRKYAFENIEEFFAVAVENFCEKPNELKNTLPKIYSILAALFKQDPANSLTITSKDKVA